MLRTRISFLVALVFILALLLPAARPLDPQHVSSALAAAPTPPDTTQRIPALGMAPASADNLASPAATASPPPPELIRAHPLAPETEPPAPVVPTVSAGHTVGVVPYRAYQLIAAAFPDAPLRFARIAFCESRFVDAVVGEGRYVGWFQIDPGWLKDPEVRAALAAVSIAGAGLQLPPDDPDYPRTVEVSAQALTVPELNIAVAVVLRRKHPDLRDWAGTRDGCPAWNEAT